VEGVGQDCRAANVALRLTPWLQSGCLYQKLDSTIMVMKSAEDGRGCDAAHVLDGAMDWSVLVERPTH